MSTPSLGPTRRRRRRVLGTTHEIDPLTRLWALRCLVPLKGQTRFLQPYGFHDDDLARALGFEVDVIQIPAHKALARLREWHREAEDTAHDLGIPKTLAGNLDRLAGLVGLTIPERRLLEFVVMMQAHRFLTTAMEQLGEHSTASMFRVVSVIVGLNEAEVRAALSGRGTLSRTGLVSLMAEHHHDLPGKLSLISRKFADQMISIDSQPEEILRDKVCIAPPPELALSDYLHLASSLDILRPYLRHVLETARTGVNILLHGPPGTGKTQLARALAGEMDYQLFEVTSEDEDGDPIDGDARLRAMRLAQHFFVNQKSLILFDEIEDVFNDGKFDRGSTAQTHKAWMNRMLEGNALPCMWLTNDISEIDPAFIRRFDMVIEVPVPPLAQRERIVRAACNDLAGDATVARIAMSGHATPAVVARAANVVRCIRGEIGGNKFDRVLESLVDGTLAAQGHPSLRTSDANRLPKGYDPAFINADADLTGIANAMQQARSARMCLYGPPGTGKTAYGRWLAEQLGMPLLVRRASDLLGPFVGMSEQAIAQAFREAERENAVLLIDEVDSFLRDRSGARQGWEATLVNEMLTQMEAFSGVFVASTNLMDGLDPAALRRFDLKVKFDYLKPGQALELLRRHCGKLGLPMPDELEERVRRHLRPFTPGDFAAVMRQQRFRPSADFDHFFAALQAECMLKTDARPAMGFIH